ncbi:putative zinc finger, CCHC-type containing protein, partial [Tanacetum coccineum]
DLEELDIKWQMAMLSVRINRFEKKARRKMKFNNRDAARTPYIITEDTVRSQLQLGDDGGIEDLPIADIYLGMDNLGYPTEGKLTFHKNKFSPQWRFLVHTIQHCLSTKSGSWDQFGSPLAISLICLSDERRFNWSSYIFKEMNGVVEIRNRTLVKASRMMLSAFKLPLFFWAEAIATACYTQNRSIIIPTHEKTAYHIINDRKPLIKHLHIFGYTCYLTRDGENLDNMKEKGDPCILVGYSTQSKGYRVYNKRTRFIVESIHLGFDEIKEMSETSVANDTSGLVPQRQKASDYDNPDPAPELQNVSSSADTTVPSQQELDLLFGPLYDEFFNDGTSRVNKSSSPTDNSAPQDTHPSTNIHPTSEPTTQTNVHTEENNDNQAEFSNPFCTPIHEHAESSSRNIGNSNVHTFNQHQNSEYRWTKDHPLTQVCGNPSKPVQTRRQLATYPEIIVEPENIKEAMADSAWIEQTFWQKSKVFGAQEEGIDFEDSFAPVARVELAGF